MHVYGEVQLTGSNAKLFIPIVATTSEKSINLPFNSRQVLLINDGGGDISFAFDGKQAGGKTYALTDPALVFAGTTWSNVAFDSVPTNYTAVLNATATLKTSQIGTLTMTVNFLSGSGTGIAKLELSKDDGVTWSRPSDLPGISRSDGATGLSLDTYDCYLVVATQAAPLTFILPYDPTSVWALRIKVTGTKNSSSGSVAIYIQGFKMTDSNSLPVKNKETIGLDIQTSQISYKGTDIVNARVVVV